MDADDVDETEVISVGLLAEVAVDVDLCFCLLHMTSHMDLC